MRQAAQESLSAPPRSTRLSDYPDTQTGGPTERTNDRSDERIASKGGLHIPFRDPSSTSSARPITLADGLRRAPDHGRQPGPLPAGRTTAGRKQARTSGHLDHQCPEGTLQARCRSCRLRPQDPLPGSSTAPGWLPTRVPSCSSDFVSSSGATGVRTARHAGRIPDGRSLLFLGLSLMHVGAPSPKHPVDLRQTDLRGRSLRCQQPGHTRCAGRA